MELYFGMANETIKTASNIPAHIVIIPLFSWLLIRYFNVSNPVAVSIKAVIRISGEERRSMYCDNKTPGIAIQSSMAGMTIEK